MKKIKEKYNCETFAELISKKKPKEIIDTIKNLGEKINDNGETDYSQNHQWLKKETRMINSITFSELDEERFTELCLALGKIINQIEQQEYEDNPQESNI